MKKRIASIICGLGIMIMTIILVIDVKKTAISFQMNTQTSMGVDEAVRLTSIIDGAIIYFFTIMLVLLNIFDKKNK